MVLGHWGAGVGGDRGVLMLLVVPPPLTMHERRPCAARICAGSGPCVVCVRRCWCRTEFRGTAVAVGVGECVAGAVLRGLGSGVVRCCLARFLVGAPRAVGGCAGGPPGPVWGLLCLTAVGGRRSPLPMWGDGALVCQGCAALRQVSRPLTFSRWSRGSNCAAADSLGAVRWMSLKDAQPSGRLRWVRGGGVCFVEEFAEGVGCSFLSAKSIVEPAGCAPEVAPHPLRCCGCYLGCWKVWVWKVDAAVVEVEGEKYVVDCLQIFARNRHDEETRKPSSSALVMNTTICVGCNRDTVAVLAWLDPRCLARTS